MEGVGGIFPIETCGRVVRPIWLKPEPMVKLEQ